MELYEVTMFRFHKGARVMLQSCEFFAQDPVRALERASIVLAPGQAVEIRHVDVRPCPWGTSLREVEGTKP